MTSKKSQVTMEFLALNGFLFLMATLFVVGIGIQLGNFQDREHIEAVKDFGAGIQQEIELASTVKEGYIRKINVPNEINGRINYTLTMKKSTLIIQTEEYEFSAIIPDTKGTIKKGDNTIRKINNTVNIENG